jgi:osomolarity two-component system, sensor histidine kinase TcsA
MVANAMKFTDTGYVRVCVSSSGEDETSYNVMTEVVDTGIGVPLHAVNELFTPFTQFDSSATKRYKGTGLGLSICKSLAEAMGGVVGFRPNPDGHGSVFWFTAKVVKLDETYKPPPPIAVPHAEIMKVAEGKQLLLADDNIVNQTVMRRLLKGLGFETVDIALDGLQAVQLIRQKRLAYHLILMDISMPVMDGISATKEIRNMGLDIPIVAMTANALKGDREAYLAKGLSDYIAKPVDRRLLMETLVKWLK